jgi:ABC-type transporter Mla subunit MlaD
MTTGALVVSTLLLTALAGAAFIVLYQIYQVLMKAHALLDAAGPRLVRALDLVSQAADRVNGVGSTLESEAQMLKPLFETASSVGRSINRSGKWLVRATAMGVALGPAVLAGLRALSNRHAQPPVPAAPPVHRINSPCSPDDHKQRFTHSGETS